MQHYAAITTRVVKGSNNLLSRLRIWKESTATKAVLIPDIFLHKAEGVKPFEVEDYARRKVMCGYRADGITTSLCWGSQHHDANKILAMQILLRLYKPPLTIRNC